MGCRFAPRCQDVQPSCLTTAPTLEDVEEGHLVSCFFPVGSLRTGEPMSSATEASDEKLSNAVDGVAPSVGDGVAVPLLQLDQVSKEFVVSSGGFGRNRGLLSAVEDVSLSIVSGETFGLVGESGCGKSTLGRMITALDRPTRGRITVDGKDLASLGRRELRVARRDLQLMFQDPYASLDPA